jgi:hypothetical protein
MPMPQLPYKRPFFTVTLASNEIDVSPGVQQVAADAAKRASSEAVQQQAERMHHASWHPSAHAYVLYMTIGGPAGGCDLHHVEYQAPTTPQLSSRRSGQIRQE